ncbi:MAG: hypothetical protein ACLUOI_01715 [Eisenbergiella sp.]
MGLTLGEGVFDEQGRRKIEWFFDRNRAETPGRKSGFRQPRRVAWGAVYGSRAIASLYHEVSDDNGMIHTLKPLHVLSSEQKYYGGVLSRKYRCSVAGEGRLREFELLHCPEEGTWDLILNP